MNEGETEAGKFQSVNNERETLSQLKVVLLGPRVLVGTCALGFL